MLKLNTRLAAIAALAIGAIASPAYADIVVDDFNSPVYSQLQVWPSIPGQPTPPATIDRTGTVPAIIGGTANYRLDYQQVLPTSPGEQSATLSVYQGTFGLQTGNGADAALVAMYNGGPGFGINSPGLNMTIPNFEGFRFAYVADLGFNAKVNIYDTNGNLVSTASPSFFAPNLPGNPFQTAFISKSSFSDPTVFSTAIGAIELVFDPPASGDVTLKGPLVLVTSVPEPSSIALVASTLIPGALIWRSRRNKKAKAS